MNKDAAWRAAIIVFLSFLVCSCNSQTLVKQLVSSRQETIARSYSDDLRTRKFAPIEADMTPQYRTAELPALLLRMSNIFPSETPKDVKTVGFRVVKKSGFSTYEFVFEYEFSHGAALTNVVLTESSGKTALAGLHVENETLSLEQQNAFTLTGKPLAFYLILAAAIFMCIFTIGSAIFCALAKDQRRKWLWVIFCLIGIFQLNLNWASGAIGFKLLSINLFAAAYMQDLYGPPIISFGVPIGAIFFWIRYQRQRASRLADLQRFD